MQTPPSALEKRGTLTIFYSGKTHGGISALYQVSERHKTEGIALKLETHELNSSKL